MASITASTAMSGNTNGAIAFMVRKWEAARSGSPSAFSDLGRALCQCQTEPLWTLTLCGRSRESFRCAP